ncbi:phosphoglucosamine mutase [Lactobacillus sanfranciscensis]|uniref:Phosphoglucosamine mutase n=1 Tax=Fructilactobacillus sanfranciscensis (strain TMW 1.1304) TaxID=714313 RepID=G2KVG9_FRUST|nr:phosphoglucosamine mutase [Fructilactobacillus sanfranciscensis]AEN98984.1 Phosphoglucosamine mutase [Fructilactobacillus sanfranciscensis TMW 1.1304]NDR75498.1 phosphoglucosamine mutase [Fructilactobacillus sanfranciscensis]NDR96255.1 phosphoglucosamine mutase [Fructilactobacillus sanfranciscensis]NDS04032.1 phosphoglucosamine mutase [Fructilactobacillus sanfranciscensis]POH19095.1 phosphoglucosamine mutase [Fructilactobacillus sanfranciscensis]
MKYFGTDGIRGVANQELTPELAFRAGRAGGYALTKRSSEAHQPRVLVSRDTRISGQMLEDALVAGLLSVGIEVIRLGIVTTPGVAYLVRDQSADAGVMITASHNPAEYNGIKFFGGDGYKLSDEIEEDIEAMLESDVDNLPRPSAEGLGTAAAYNEAGQKYLHFLAQSIPDNLEGIKVSVDAANGATSALMPRLYADLGLDFKTMATKPNGININDNVGSTHPEQLQKMVVENGSQLGIAFDGDGDRCIAVDEKGNIVDGDKIMYICGKYMDEHGRLKHDTIVTTVMSNLGMYKAMEAHGMKSVKTKVGDRYVVEEMNKNGYNLGGEQSGHIVFLDFVTTGDGMLTSLQLMSIMKETGKKLSELADEVTKYPQSLVNVTVKDKKHAMDPQAVKDIIAEVEKEMHGDGRILVRPSGTEPLLRVMVEAPTQKESNEYAQRIANVVEKNNK